MQPAPDGTRVPNRPSSRRRPGIAHPLLGVFRGLGCGRKRNPMNMSQPLELGLCGAAKPCGLFGLPRRLTAPKLRMLAHHGFFDGVDTRFRNKLFISSHAADRRLKIV